MAKSKYANKGNSGNQVGKQKYTPKQIDYVMECYAEGYGFREIMQAFNKKFKKRLNEHQIRKIYRHYEVNYDWTGAISNTDRRRSQSKHKMIDDYYKAVKKLGRRPNENTLRKETNNFCHIGKLFGSISKLESEAEDKYPDIFDDVVDEKLFTKKRLAGVKETLKKTRKFFITSAVTDKKVHKGAYDAVKTWEKEEKGKLIIMPCSDPASTSNASWSLDQCFKNDEIIFQDTAINPHLMLSCIKLQAKQILPLSGMDRIVQGNGYSMIIASPKQRCRHIPSFNERTSTLALAVPGAITLPDYKPVDKNFNQQGYFSERTGYLAEHDHVLGGIIVELEGDGSFHFRQVQFEPKSGAFVDLGKRYSSRAVTDNRVSLIRPGDYHCGHTDPRMRQAIKDVCKKYRPKYLVIEDFNNGHSISPFDKYQKIQQCKKNEMGLTSLEEEGRLLAREAEYLCSLDVKEVIMIRDNHSLFLERYLERCEYKDDKENHIIALELALAKAQGWDVTEYLVRKYADEKKIKKCRWLVKDESFAPNGIENSIHGFQYRGRRTNSPSVYDMAYGPVNIGHDHSAKQFRNVMCCGTSTYLTSEHIEYIEGASNWTHTMIFEHENGSRQLVNLVKNKHRL